MLFFEGDTLHVRLHPGLNRYGAPEVFIQFKPVVSGAVDRDTLTAVAALELGEMLVAAARAALAMERRPKGDER
jgi:hypothetical protein